MYIVFPLSHAQMLLTLAVLVSSKVVRGQLFSPLIDNQSTHDVICPCFSSSVISSSEDLIHTCLLAL